MITDCCGTSLETSTNSKDQAENEENEEKAYFKTHSWPSPESNGGRQLYQEMESPMQMHTTRPSLRVNPERNIASRK
jgi:hypothetical protein